VVGFAVGFVAAGVGEVGGAEGGGPDTVEVVLGFAQSSARASPSRPSPASACSRPSMARDGLEISVQVIGRGIVWAAFGQLSPLLAFTLPVKEIRAGEDKLVSVVAFRAPDAAPTVDDGLEVCRSRPRRGYCGG
jgi:hypothetical protein